MPAVPAVCYKAGHEGIRNVLRSRVVAAGPPGFLCTVYSVQCTPSGGTQNCFINSPAAVLAHLLVYTPKGTKTISSR